MSTIVSLDTQQSGSSSSSSSSFYESDQPKWLVTVKGAPDVIQDFLAEVPPHYEQTYKLFSRQGYRVIALAYRPFTPPPVSPSISRSQQLAELDRAEVESGLQFAGLLIFDCPLKEESAPTMQKLIDSSHEVVMITGDSPLTACKVAQDLKMTSRPTLILELDHGYGLDPDHAQWVSIDEKTRIPLKETSPKQLKDYDLCVSGAALDLLVQENLYRDYLLHISVYARVSPMHKELVIATLKKVGMITLMCGDGTNDVGALKQAHIGVALLNTPFKKKPEGGPVMSVMEQIKQHQQRMREYQAQLQAQRLQIQKGTPASSLPKLTPPAPPKRPGFGPPSLVDDEDISVVQLGDASIASPFTSKGNSIENIEHIIRQGRCTLVTTLQMFIILALNCLIYAYSLSVLYLEGVKMGDGQATTIGMLIAFCFLFVTRSKPLEKLSKERPASTIFTAKFFVSLLGQFAIHMYSLMFVHNMAKVAMGDLKLEPDAEFAPNLVNSAIFLISSSMQVSTFAVNYRGHPFMQSLWENKPLVYILAFLGGLTLLAASQVSPEITSMLELVEFTPEFRSTMLVVIIADFLCAFVWDRLASLIFGRT